MVPMCVIINRGYCALKGFHYEEILCLSWTPTRRVMPSNFDTLEDAQNSVDRAQDERFKSFGTCYEILLWDNYTTSKNGLIIPAKHCVIDEDSSGADYHWFSLDYLLLKTVIECPDERHSRVFIPPKVPNTYKKFIPSNGSPEQLCGQVKGLFEDYFCPKKMRYLGENCALFFTGHLGRHKTNLMLAKELAREISTIGHDSTRLLQLLWQYRARAFHDNVTLEPEHRFNENGSFVRRINYAITTVYNRLNSDERNNIALDLGEKPSSLKESYAATNSAGVYIFSESRKFYY